MILSIEILKEDSIISLNEFNKILEELSKQIQYKSEFKKRLRNRQKK